jgi:soluble cytochrome b562
MVSRGCTTPQQIQNLKNSIEDNIDYLDGFDELPSELQAKVLKTLEEGHVDDAEWKGV